MRDAKKMPSIGDFLHTHTPAGLHVVGHFSHLVHGTEFVQDWYTSLRFAPQNVWDHHGVFFRESSI